MSAADLGVRPGNAHQRVTSTCVGLRSDSGARKCRALGCLLLGQVGEPCTAAITQVRHRRKSTSFDVTPPEPRAPSVPSISTCRPHVVLNIDQLQSAHQSD